MKYLRLNIDGIVINYEPHASLFQCQNCQSIHMSFNSHFCPTFFVVTVRKLFFPLNDFLHLNWGFILKRISGLRRIVQHTVLSTAGYRLADAVTVLAKYGNMRSASSTCRMMNILKG